MPQSKLDNYLRTHRKRAGLTQREVAFLLGCRNAAQVSRYEKRHRIPTLRTALACRSILGVPLETLFAGIHEKVDRETTARKEKLRSELEARQERGRRASVTARKLRWLRESHSLSRHDEG